MAAGMRPRPTAPLLRALPLLAIAIGACALTGPEDDSFRLAGTVRSAFSDTPVAGARVSLVTRPGWFISHEVLGTGTTDAKGGYEFTARQPAGKAAFGNCEILAIEVEADRYEAWNIFSGPEVACSADLQTHDFRLVPFPESLTVLPDTATVRVGETVTLTAAITNVDGSHGPSERLHMMWNASRFADRVAGSTGPCGVIEPSLSGSTAIYRAPDAVPSDSCGGSAPGEVKLSMQAWQVDTVHLIIVP